MLLDLRGYSGRHFETTRRTEVMKIMSSFPEFSQPNKVGTKSSNKRKRVVITLNGGHFETRKQF